MARIVFDLDGTLIDSAPDIQGIANAVLSEEGFAPITLSDSRRFIGSGTSVFVERLRAARGIGDDEQQRLHSAFLARYDAAVGLTHTYPDVPEALAALRSSGHRLGVCTNKPSGPTKAVLAHLDLEGFFGIALGGDSLPVRKPDPAPLRAALDALGDGPAIYVGDSEVDAETARRAGVPFLLFTEGYRKTDVSQLPHDAAFSDFADLPALVEDLIAQAARQPRA